MHDHSQASDRLIELGQYRRNIERTHPSWFFETHTTFAFDLESSTSVRGRDLDGLDRMGRKATATFRKLVLFAGFPRFKHPLVYSSKFRLQRRNFLFNRILFTGAKYRSGLDAWPWTHTAIAVVPFIAK